MLTLEQYILNQQIDQILEDINNESINEGKVAKAIKKFWTWLFGGSSDTKNFSYKGSHFGNFPDDLDEDEIKTKLSDKKMDYIDFEEIHNKKMNTNCIDLVKGLIQNYPGQFNYVESLFQDTKSILSIIQHNDQVRLGILKCEDPFNINKEEKKILITGLCLYIPKLNLTSNKVLERIHKYSGTDKYDEYGFIICLDIMKNCKFSRDDYHLENQLYKQIILSCIIIKMG